MKPPKHLPSPPDFATDFAESIADELRPLTKPWWQSRGVVGPLVAVLSLVAGWLGVEVDPASQAYVVDQAVAALAAGGVLAGAVTGIVGRLRATRAIR